MVHWFRRDRCGQIRGIPEITPAVPLFAQLRRFTLATIAAAETAADFAGILKSDAAAAETDPADPWETIEIEQRTLMTLPMGWSLQQFKPEQPTTNYGMFKAEILGEIARCMHLPYVIASGDYKQANYSSGRLAHQVYFKSVIVDRAGLEKVGLDLILFAWLNEAVMVPGLLPRGLTWTELKHAWRWDGWVHVDPQKEADAAKTMLGARLTTLAEYYAERGQDWEAQLEQRALEIERARDLGLPPTLEENPGQAWQEDGAAEPPPVGNESSDEQTLEEDAAEAENA
jgi:capsid protein